MKKKGFAGLMFMLIVSFTLIASTSFADDYYRDWVKTQNLTVKNVPVFEQGIGIETSGATWYVDSGASGDASGTSWSNACLTVDAAINKATASNGDVIRVAAGHAETIAAADGFDLDKASITIVHHGSGSAMGTYTFTATASTIAVGAANCRIIGGNYVAGISDIVKGFAIEAGGDNFTLEGAVFPKPATNSYEFLDAIECADGADYITIKNCEYYNDEGGAAANHFIEAGNGTAGPERLQVINCYIKGDFAVSAIWSDEPCDEAFIAGNTIINHTTGQHCIEFTDSGTGAIINNNLYGDTIAAILDPGSMYEFNNRLSVASDADGVPLWALDNSIDHLAYVGTGTAAYPGSVTDESILAYIMAVDADVSDYDESTDSLEALGTAMAKVPLSDGSNSWNSTALAAIEGEVTDAIEADDLDHLAKAGTGTAAYPGNVTDESIIAYIMAIEGDISDYDEGTDSLEAISGAVATAQADLDILTGASGANLLTATQASIDAIEADTSAMDTNTEINVLWAHPRCVAKTDGAVLTGDDALFTISGGPVRAKITGIVTTLVGGASSAKLQMDVTTPAGTVELNAGAVAIDNDAAGTLYYNVGATSVFTPVTAGAVILDPVTVEEAEFILPPGTVMANFTAAQDGVIAWYMTYTPMSPNSVVVAAP